MSLRVQDSQTARQFGKSLVAAPGAKKQIVVYGLAVSVDAQTTVTFDGGYVNEIQSMYNDATGGTFTASFDGQGPTANIAYNADAATLKTALQTMSNITDVTVTGAGTIGDPWLITFIDPGGQNIDLITTNDALLTGLATTIIESTKGVAAVDEIQSVFNGATGGTFTLTFDSQPTGNLAYNIASADLKTALEGLSSITTVTVTGAGTSGDPWLVTFTDPGAQDVVMLIADDALLTGGTPSSTIAEDTKGAVPVDEIQSVHNEASGGTFKLTYAAAETGAINHNASAGTVETALQALGTITDVDVTGAGTVGDPWLVVFVNPGAEDIALMTSDDELLTGESSTVSETTTGAATKLAEFFFAVDRGEVLPISDDPWFVLTADKALTYSTDATAGIAISLVYEEIDT